MREDDTTCNLCGHWANSSTPATPTGAAEASDNGPPGAVGSAGTDDAALIAIAGMSREDCARRIETLVRERDKLQELLGEGIHTEVAARKELLKAKAERDEAVKRMEAGWIQVCAEPAIKHFKEVAEKVERERDAMREALTELVACKDLKENAEAMNVLLSEYNQRKDPAWASARAAIDAARWENP